MEELKLPSGLWKGQLLDDGNNICSIQSPKVTAEQSINDYHSHLDYRSEAMGSIYFPPSKRLRCPRSDETIAHVSGKTYMQLGMNPNFSSCALGVTEHQRIQEFYPKPMVEHNNFQGMVDTSTIINSSDSGKGISSQPYLLNDISLCAPVENCLQSLQQQTWSAFPHSAATFPARQQQYHWNGLGASLPSVSMIQGPLQRIDFAANASQKFFQPDRDPQNSRFVKDFSAMPSCLELRHSHGSSAFVCDLKQSTPLTQVVSLDKIKRKLQENNLTLVPIDLEELKKTNAKVVVVSTLSNVSSNTSGDTIYTNSDGQTSITGAPSRRIPEQTSLREHADQRWQSYPTESLANLRHACTLDDIREAGSKGFSSGKSKLEEEHCPIETEVQILKQSDVNFDFAQTDASDLIGRAEDVDGYMHRQSYPSSLVDTKTDFHGFDLWRSKFKSLVQQEAPGCTSEQLEYRLQAVWKLLPADIKAKYSAIMTTSNHVPPTAKRRGRPSKKANSVLNSQSWKRRPSTSSSSEEVTSSPVIRPTPVYMRQSSPIDKERSSSSDDSSLPPTTCQSLPHPANLSTSVRGTMTYNNSELQISPIRRVTHGDRHMMMQKPFVSDADTDGGKHDDIVMTASGNLEERALADVTFSSGELRVNETTLDVTELDSFLSANDSFFAKQVMGVENEQCRDETCIQASVEIRNYNKKKARKSKRLKKKPKVDIRDMIRESHAPT